MAREWLARIREAKGMSQAEVGKQSGIVQQSYQQIEKGESRPKIETAKRIATVLGFSWTRFYEEDEAECAGAPDGKSDDVDAFSRDINVPGKMDRRAGQEGQACIGR